MRSGSVAGTVMAIVPPGRSTRVNSARAATSSSMCSITSLAMTRSKAPSANGRWVASPLAVSSTTPGATSSASHMAATVARTC